MESIFRKHRKTLSQVSEWGPDVKDGFLKVKLKVDNESVFIGLETEYDSIKYIRPFINV